jgi:hypothetical protein
MSINTPTQGATMQETAKYPSIEAVTCPKVSTVLAAHWLGRQPQTLRSWSCHQNGPLQPVLVHGRLAWDVAEIKRLLQVG